MELKKYTEMVKDTSVFPSTVNNFELAYGFMGLIGETAELTDAIDRYQADSTEDNKNLLIKEFGDVHWYLAAIAQERTLNLSAIFMFEGKKKSLDNVKDILSFFEILKKYYRDGKEIDNKQLTEVLVRFYTRTIKPSMEYYNIELDTILETNYNKLTKRKLENKLQGDGDNR